MDEIANITFPNQVDGRERTEKNLVKMLRASTNLKLNKQKI